MCTCNYQDKIMHLWQEVPIIAILLLSSFIRLKQLTEYKIKNMDKIKNFSKKKKNQGKKLEIHHFHTIIENDFLLGLRM